MKTLIGKLRAVFLVLGLLVVAFTGYTLNHVVLVPNPSVSYDAERATATWCLLALCLIGLPATGIGAWLLAKARRRRS